MPTFLSQRLLSVLQLTRMALVFTAVPNTLCELALLAKYHAREAGTRVDVFVFWDQWLAISLMSVGLYSFGMSLNDIIDRRRDSQLAAHRPLPSGKIGIATAHVICAGSFLLAAICGAYYAWRTPTGDLSLVLLTFTTMLITFYDFAGKYLVWPGILTLGFIRFFHATIPAPMLPLAWHPLLLLNHVTILSAFAYQFEKKRPRLTRAHWIWVIIGLVVSDAICIGAVLWRRHHRFENDAIVQSLWIEPGLIYPAVAALVFIGIAIGIYRRSADVRRAGQNLMLAGLLWLIVYDVCFVAGYVGLVPALLMLLFAPAAYASVQFMRWWANLLSISQRPAFQRAR